MDTTRVEAKCGVDGVWREFRRSGGANERRALIDHYRGGLVRKLARRLRAKLPPEIDVEDLEQEGAIALNRAIDRFDPTRGAAFTTFASRHIIGAMLDFLRKVDPASRLARQAQKSIEEARETFRKRHGRDPTERELRIEFGMKPKAFERLLSRSRPPAMLTLATRPEDGGESETLIDSIAEDPGPAPSSASELAELKRSIIRDLPRRDRLIVMLYYDEDLTMAETADVLGLSESRVSQEMKRLRGIVRERANRLTGE